MAKLQHVIQLPPPGASDVGTREFNLKVGDVVQPPSALPGTATTATFVVDPEAAVDCFLVDIDTSGNRSAESPHLAFIAKDTFAPPAPGALGIVSVTEVPG